MSGNIRPQPSQLAELLWTDPGIKSGISVHELISIKEKERKKKGRWGINGRTFSQNPRKQGKSHRRVPLSFSVYVRLPCWSSFLSGCAKVTSKLVGWCFEPSQPHRITSGLNTNFTLSPSYSRHKSSHYKSRFLSLFIVRGHSTREPDSGKVTYFTLQA